MSIDVMLDGWDKVDRLIREVGALHNGFWPIKVEWRPEAVYEVTFAYGPGRAWASFKYLPRTREELVATFDRVKPKDEPEGGAEPSESKHSPN